MSEESLPASKDHKRRRSRQRPTGLSALVRVSCARRCLTSLVVICGVLAGGASSTAHAEDAAAVTVAPFDEEGSAARDLSSAVELELEFEEHLLMKPWMPLLEEIGTSQVGDVGTDTLGRAMEGLGLDAVIRAEVVEGHSEVRMLYLHRSPTGEVVYALPVRIPDAMKNPREAMVVPLSEALRDLAVLAPLSARALDAILYDFIGEVPTHTPESAPDSDPESAPESDPDSDPESAPEARRPIGGEPTPASPEEDPEAAAPEAAPAEPTNFARLVRVAAYYSPSFVNYRACQPGTHPFFGQCEPAADSALDTEVPMLMLGTAAIFAESFALPFVGFAAGASTGVTQVRTNNDSIDPFLTAQINADFAVIPHLALTFDDIGVRLGARIGYGLSLGFTELQNNDFGITLLPSHDSHQVLLGARVSVGLRDAFEVSVDVDAIPYAFHQERPDSVGAPSYAGGARGRVNADLLLFSGIRVGLFAEASALDIQTKGEGSRLSRQQLQPFNNGNIFIVTARIGIGVGFGL